MKGSGCVEKRVSISGRRSGKIGSEGREEGFESRFPFRFHRSRFVATPANRPFPLNYVDSIHSRTMIASAGTSARAEKRRVGIEEAFQTEAIKTERGGRGIDTRSRYKLYKLGADNKRIRGPSRI